MSLPKLPNHVYTANVNINRIPCSTDSWLLIERKSSGPKKERSPSTNPEPFELVSFSFFGF